MHASEREKKDFAVISSIPPQDVECEMTVLGALLNYPGSIDRVLDHLQPEDFYVSAHATIYGCMVENYNNQQPHDETAVRVALQNKKLFEKVGGREVLHKLSQYGVSAVNLDALTGIIREKSLRRKIIALGGKVSRLGTDTFESTEKIVEQAEKEIFDLRVQNKQRAGELVHTGEAAVEMFNAIEECAFGEKRLGISTGFYDLDSMLGGGVEGGQLIVIGARPGQGKSALALNIAWYIAYELRKLVMFYSLEMSRDQLLRRQTSALSRIELSYLRSGQIAQNQWTDLADAMEKLNEAKLFICDTADVRFSNIRSEVKRVSARQEQMPGLIVVDYLQLLAGIEDDKDQNMVSKVTKISRQLKLLAKEFNVPVIALSQLNRSVEARQSNKRPMLSDLRESGAIEQDSDVVMLLYRDEYYNPDTQEKGIAELNIAKQRDGGTGVIKLLFDGHHTTFRNLAR